MTRDHHACAACGNRARPGDPLRVYKIERRYPQPAPRFLPRMPRYEVLRCHRSELADPASGLYRPPRLVQLPRLRRWSHLPVVNAAGLVVFTRLATWHWMTHAQLRAAAWWPGWWFITWHLAAAVQAVCCAVELAAVAIVSARLSYTWPRVCGWWARLTSRSAR